MKNLNNYRLNITSQNGEDGVIDFLRRTLHLDNSGWCCEFGAWDGRYLSNTYVLWEQYGLNAVLIEGNVNKFIQLKIATYNFDNVYAINAMVANNHKDKNSLDNILDHSNILIDELDVLSIDVDGYEFSIWKSFKGYHPKIVIIEINPYHKPTVDFRDNITDDTFFLGTTPKPMVALGKEKGYELVAHLACNLIFVRKDLYYNMMNDTLDSNSLESLYDYKYVLDKE